MSVNVDGLSNGARTMFEQVLLEARETRREFRSSRRWGVATVLAIAGLVFAAGEFRQETLLGLDARPTSEAVTEMIESRDKAFVAALHEQQLLLETLAERSKAHREDIDALQGDHNRFERFFIPRMTP